MNIANLLLRIRGAGALTDPEVANALRLSDTQVVRIRNLQRTNTASLKDRLRALFRRDERPVSVLEAMSADECGADGESTPKASLRDSLRELQVETERQSLCVLSDEQKKRLARMQGLETL